MRAKRNKDPGGGRTAKGRGVSFPEEMSEAIDKRLETLAPFVSGLSAYVQRLVWLDLNRGLLRDDGSINEAAVLTVKSPNSREGRGRSFSPSHNANATPDAGVDNVLGTVHNGAADCVGVVAQLVEHHNGIVSPAPVPSLVSSHSAGLSRASISREILYLETGDFPGLPDISGGVFSAPHGKPVSLMLFQGDLHDEPSTTAALSLRRAA